MPHTKQLMWFLPCHFQGQKGLAASFHDSFFCIQSLLWVEVYEPTSHATW